jgi:hypothetical protein
VWTACKGAVGRVACPEGIFDGSAGDQAVWTCQVAIKQCMSRSYAVSSGMPLVRC